MSYLTKFSNSKYLKKEDVIKPLLLTIVKSEEEDLAFKGELPKMRDILYFEETDKGFVTGKVTKAQIATFLGEPGPGETCESWYGHKIVLFCDPTVMMSGKVVGGIRVRAPRMPASVGAGHAQSKPAPQPPPVEEDDVPY